MQTPWFLLILGAGGVVGNLIGGPLADWKLMPSLVGIFSGQALLALALLFTSTSPLLLAINLFIMGAVNFSFGPHVTKRILYGARAAPNLASTLNNTAFNIGIGAGAWVGSVALSAGLGYAQLPWLPFVLCSAAACVIAISMLLDQRSPAPGTEAA